MSNTTFTTTEQSAREAVEKFATPVYAHFGLRAETKRRMVEELTNPENARRKRENRLREPSLASIKIRRRLWAYGGGTASASVTCEIMTELGRGDELGYLVEEGHFKK